MIRTVAIIAVTAAALAAGSASAEVYDFSFTGVGVSGSGQIDTVGAATSPVTAVTGTVFDSAFGPGPLTITTLSGYAAADNILYAGSPYASFGGISFNTATGPTFNIGGGGTLPGGLVLNDSVNNPGGFPNPNGPAPGSGSTNITFTVAVPEPSTWAMMLVGFCFAGAVARTTRRRALAA